MIQQSLHGLCLGIWKVSLLHTQAQREGVITYSQGHTYHFAGSSISYPNQWVWESPVQRLEQAFVCHLSSPVAPMTTNAANLKIYSAETPVHWWSQTFLLLRGRYGIIVALCMASCPPTDYRSHVSIRRCLSNWRPRVTILSERLTYFQQAELTSMPKEETQLTK